MVTALSQRCPGCEFDGIAGPALRATGVQPIARAEDLGAVGLVEALKSLPMHIALLRTLKRRFRQHPYDAVLLVDYPGFHLRVAAAAAAAGIPVLYYIPPQVWAWGGGRLERLQSVVSRLAVTLPFERDYYRNRGVACSYVGHPLLDRPAVGTQPEARTALDIPDDRVVLGLFPGSRAAEVARLWPHFRDAGNELAVSHPDLEVTVAAIEGLEYPGSEAFRVVTDAPELVMAASTAAICKSGTTTLEAALCHTPHAIAYALHPVTAALARRLANVDHIGLGNLLADNPAVPELLQGALRRGALARAVAPLLDDASPDTQRQQRMFADVRTKLGGPGAADRVAAMTMELAA